MENVNYICIENILLSTSKNKKGISYITIERKLTSTYTAHSFESQVESMNISSLVNLCNLCQKCKRINDSLRYLPFVKHKVNMKVYGEVMGVEVMAESYLINSITWLFSWQQLAAQEKGDTDVRASGMAEI